MGKVFGKRWEILDELSEGGQAHAFLVKDLKNPDAQPSVLKRLKNPKRIDRFVAEVEAIKKVDHANVLKILDNDLDHDPAYFVTEFCEGGTLRDRCEKHWPSPLESIHLFVAIADAVNHAHSQGVIHRDIKPDNIFIRLPGGEPVVGDFGLCFLVEADARQTDLKEAVGSRWFMAPEMEDGRAEDVTPAADVYSLGKLLYWMVSHGKMFNREKLREPRFNLSDIVQHPFKKGMNPEVEHITRLLELMVVADPRGRCPLGEVILRAKQTAQIISLHLNPVATGYTQNCTYCGWGFYQEMASGQGAAVHNFGLAVVGSANWKIMACSECGHVQIFRLDMARNNNFWTK
jgi:serine/threonine protein kinase